MNIKRLQSLAPAYLFAFLTFITPSIFALEINFHSIQADFEQIVVASDSKPDEEAVVYKGVLSAKAPDKAKWVYKTPIPKEIYLNADSVWIYEPNLKQAHYLRLDHRYNIFEILKKAKFISKSNGQETYSSVIDSNEYNIIIVNGLPKEITYSDELDNKFKIVFKNIVLDVNISNKFFNFTPNADIDVITQFK